MKVDDLRNLVQIFDGLVHNGLAPGPKAEGRYGLEVDEASVKLVRYGAHRSLAEVVVSYAMEAGVFDMRHFIEGLIEGQRIATRLQLEQVKAEVRAEKARDRCRG